MKKYLKMGAGMVILLAFTAASCKNDAARPKETQKEDSIPDKEGPDNKEPIFTKTADWNNRADGSYSTAAATAAIERAPASARESARCRA